MADAQAVTGAGTAITAIALVGTHAPASPEAWIVRFSMNESPHAIARMPLILVNANPGNPLIHRDAPAVPVQVDEAPMKETPAVRRKAGSRSSTNA